MLGDYEKFITQYFGYDKVLPMNTGVEAVETAIKLSPSMGIWKKGIEENKAKIVVCAKFSWTNKYSNIIQQRPIIVHKIWPIYARV